MTPNQRQPAFLSVFPSSPDALLRFIALEIDDAMLREIAEADYGWQADRCFPMLKELRGGQTVPEFDPNLREVLELIRWSQPEQEDWKPGGTGRRGHWMRAFACTVLLRYSGQPEHLGRWDSLDPTLIQLIDSLEALDADCAKETMGFLAWFIGVLASTPYDDELPFFGLALLWTTLRSASATPDRSLLELAEWIAESERRHAYDWSASGSAAGRWLLLDFNASMKDKEWRALGRRLMALDLTGRSSELRDWIMLLGSSLAADEEQ